MPETSPLSAAPGGPDLIHEIELSPAFHDLDPMDVVWHGNYVKYLELARNALMAKFDYDYPQMRASGYAWPIVDLRLKYVGSVQYDRRIRIRARIIEWEYRLKIDYLILCAKTNAKLNKASTVQVALDLSTCKMCWVCPPVLWERLGVNGPCA
ncbi:acyl-CoA thioesterase [Verminephrobacter aporrectodeae subsp. tuberculatae]|uniref:Acyl-CoA thioesterase n=1 Tax=Verminephrobacter aporrectodeae subsp. tuberculatae TaxID=1110392 RepID=A0ABT3KRR3_9BURK|nr:acyl-CoA thioesterase [Verminephrobacter aporrectodeae]MCW5220049.1 acyl-CoA thioesterase [Verminephrobacter aporrectodeae subsp. tuberculatae]MCW5255985.1 acyl-CoA thioesterase [Verminephrobacter aporrectodeae subsp. tuberculatae]MCW5289337.1 acyl-CoA thioesterase [Verminephrobacter aporrectodeae subsp. tuberculatae]MCW5320998.1 acyl-CoA thioesterase [Verminephrobacter aporrectodeae subsp. tuberculatae]MCW8198938.1 acyl-CoA thioesterase [Verminephrobacter aporrectodeae subsp. tuberculatae]